MDKSMSDIYLLSPKVVEGINSLPMIEFETVADSLALDGVDTLIFTSKEAVKRADSIDSSWRGIDSIAIGGATKKQIEELGGRVIYQPKEFYGEVLARDIVELFANRNILYLRPKKISFDSKAYLAKHGIELREQIIYETKCRCYDLSDNPPKGSIIIFTSPSTIECFLRNFEWDMSYKAVVIGEATKVHLPKGARYFVASEPLISSCIQKALEI